MRTVVCYLNLFLIASTGFSLPGQEHASINVYSQRAYASDRRIFAEFQETHGIMINLLTGSAPELLARLEAEKDRPIADLLITTDVGALQQAVARGMLEAAIPSSLSPEVPAHLRDSNGYWIAITKRARVIIHADGKELDFTPRRYEDLITPQLSKRVVIRSSSNLYNISLLASIIAADGPDFAKTWVTTMADRSMARPPQGNDRDQIKAVIAGAADFAVANTYYLGLLIHSDDPAEQNIGRSAAIIFPNQDDRGTHINITGVGLIASSPNREWALRLIEHLLSREAQDIFVSENYEYAARSDVPPHPTVAAWGSFIEDRMNLNQLGKYYEQAISLFDQAGWQ